MITKKNTEKTGKEEQIKLKEKHSHLLKWNVCRQAGANMRKGLIFLCAVIVSFSLAACGNNNQAQNSGSALEVSASESYGTESSSQADILGEPESSKAEETQSVDADSRETTAESIPETSDVPESESESVPETGETEMAQETGPDETSVTETDAQKETEEDRAMQINVQVGDMVFSATLEKNEAVSAFVEMMREDPVVLQMSDYSGFEKVGPLGTSLPVNNSQTTTHAGDIALYNGNQIVIFYGSNSWSYTRLGRVDDLTGWEEALGSGDVTVTFSLQ